ncbi:MAG: hypothetical protein HY240_03780, partial [Actinobacteria bacterium]|nr:hypothetical protein [Actinomycetota bacterium]
GFVVFAGLLVGTLLVGIVSLQAMLAQTSFHTVQLRSEIGALADRYDVLTSEAARLSAPDRIAAWARANGMQQADPAHTVIVPVKALDGAPGSGKGGPGQDAALVKPILGSAG